jgi:single-stranded-DNA-specific exonuclease
MKKYSIKSDVPEKEREELEEYNDLIAHLLYHRGIKTSDEARTFLNPDYSLLNDPFLFKDMDIAVGRLLKAIKDDEKVTIYSDYDADGIPGAVVLSDFFKKIGFKNYDVYIPHRNKEGFGLNTKAIDRIVDGKTKLIITIDCGIADIKEAEYISESGMDLIITDHHELVEGAPKAVAIINPKQKDCKYPEKMLCGSGVVFKFVQALISKGDFDLKEGWEKWLLDMVGIATLSDMVPLVGENRILAHYGLLVLRKSPRKGLLKLLKQTKTKQQTITEDDVGFTISPRINAASRMGEPKSAFEMLSTEDDIEAGVLVSHLNEINDIRKGKVASMVKEIKKDLKEGVPDFVIARGNPKWAPSLLGLAANSIMEEYKKPVFLWGRGEGDEIKGSCRSGNFVSLIDLMKEASENVFETFGGHKQAGGFVLSIEGTGLLEKELNEAFERVSGNQYIEPLSVDKKIEISDVGYQMFNDLNKLAPFGVSNGKPLFVFEGVIPKEVNHFGKEKNHLELVFTHPKGSNLKAIAFFKDKNSWDKELKANEPMTFIANIEKSYFIRPEIRLRIVDVIKS